LDKLPLEKIVEKLKSLIPSGSENYLPVFSTTTPDSTEAFYAAFADAVSPFYNYSMMMCGFPAIVIQGTAEDWTKLSDYWRNLSKMKLFSKCSEDVRLYVGGVQTVLDLCRDSVVTGAFAEQHWKNMFEVENCGSGHDRQVVGWITKLYKTKPRLAYSENFSSHISKVNYKQLDTGINYSAYYGLFSSDVDGNILRPKYGCIITEDMTGNKEPKATELQVIALNIESTKINTKKKRLSGVWQVVTDESHL
jgi:hypothetical protein